MILTAWKLIHTKRKAIFFSLVNEPLLLSVKLELNEEIEFINAVKSLSVIFSSHWNWDYHVDYVLTKLNRIREFLCRYWYTLWTNLKKDVYNALFLSHLMYCHCIWGSRTKVSSKLLLVQKKSHRTHCQHSMVHTHESQLQGI